MDYLKFVIVSSTSDADVVYFYTSFLKCFGGIGGDRMDDVNFDVCRVRAFIIGGEMLLHIEHDVLEVLEYLLLASNFLKI